MMCPSYFAEYEPRKKSHSGVPPDLIIREASPADASALGALKRMREGGAIEECAARFDEEISGLCKTGNRLLLVALADNVVIGYGRASYFTHDPDAPKNTAPEGWYLSGILVNPAYRRRGAGSRLAKKILDWIGTRAGEAYSFCNAMNRVSIEFHRRFGFLELTRDFAFPGVTFRGGEGILFKVELSQGQDQK